MNHRITTKTTNAIILAIASAALIVLAGCSLVDEPISFTARPAPVAIALPATQMPMPIPMAPMPMTPMPITPTHPLAAQPPAQPHNLAPQQRFTDSNISTMGAVESALMWSEKYDQLSIETDTLREKNRTVLIENSTLKEDLAKLNNQLTQTRTELDEASTFLQEMHIELTKWKGDVLGFRDEIRRSQATQLQALSRVLKLLGAEPAELAASRSQTATDDQPVTNNTIARSY